MKITESTLALQAQASRTSRLQVNESLEVWPGTRSAGAEPSLSTAGRQALQAEESAAPEAASGGAPLDAKLALVKAIVERLLGHSITLLSSEDIAATAVAEGSPAPGANASGANAPAGGFAYSRSETLERTEVASFDAAGTVRTADGREIAFQLSLSMARFERETRSVSLQAGVAKDPLVVNFGADAASLRSQRFSFDLQGNGQAVDMPLLGRGSGFLVLDALDGGRVASGRQLFGPASGDGFADLAAYDDDGNGWIDEADPVFGRLGVWTPEADGGGAVRSLAEVGVGALGLAHAATPFTLKDAGTLGAIRSSCVYLSEAGAVGSLQQVDVIV